MDLDDDELKATRELYKNKLKPKYEKYYGTQGIYIMPMCPKCNEPLYEPEKCVFCGQEIDYEKENK